MYRVLLVSQDKNISQTVFFDESPFVLVPLLLPTPKQPPIVPTFLGGGDGDRDDGSEEGATLNIGEAMYDRVLAHEAPTLQDIGEPEFELEHAPAVMPAAARPET